MPILQLVSKAGPAIGDDINPKMIALEHGVDYDEMWSFADEIHKSLGNRPKMYPGFIGGHCIVPNLDLIPNQTLDLIKKLNYAYAKKVKDAKSIAKKYTSK